MTELSHYGTPRHSGRYPWGSGKEPKTADEFVKHIRSLERDGMTETQIASALGMSTTELRSRKSLAKNEVRKENLARAIRMKDSGASNVAIGEALGINESSVRDLLAKSEKIKEDRVNTVASALKDRVATDKYIDVGLGAETAFGISKEQLRKSIRALQDEGYQIHYVKMEQLGTGKETSYKVLVPPNTPYSETAANRFNIKNVGVYSEDSGLTVLGIKPPVQINPDRVAVNWGSSKDGVIELRRGVDDISLGNSKYAQVRIAVGDKHYLKGMAVYSDNLPDGVDIMVNTPKKSTDKYDAFKQYDPKYGEDNPFGTIVRQRHYTDSNGDRKLSAVNIVNSEGDWSDWSRTLSSQVLSKQTPALARKQLGMGYDIRKDQFDEIMALTNPNVRRKMLASFSDDCNAAAVHLKAASLPRQSNHVILPLTDIKENEIYAPTFRDGEKVVLIRHPHGGIFEIPEVTVNNKVQSGKNIIGSSSRDAVGIHPRVAERLSGADFDGDTVLVIPNNKQLVKTSAPLNGLKNFDTKTSYPYRDGMKVMTPEQTQMEMGKVSNLITDMTIRGANTDEIARAVRHSMVVIDAEKHKLDFTQSAIDNGIAGLKAKYQGGRNAGAATLISRAKSESRPIARIPRPASMGGPIDPVTGKKVYIEDPKATYIDRSGKTVKRTTRSTKMAEVDDAFDLSSGRPIETIYAQHANKLKALSNTARLASISTGSQKYSPAAAKTYEPEISKLKVDLNLALQNKPLERRAQLLANATLAEKLRTNSDLTKEDIKKIKNQALTEARLRVGAKKPVISISPKQWEAIQAGAVTSSFLDTLLSNTDMDTVRQLATPRTQKTVTPSKLARAKVMLDTGYTLSEISDGLGLNTSTLNKALYPKDGE